MLNLRLKEYFIFMPMLCAYFILSIFYPFLRIDIIKFLLFQLLFLLLPGYMFSKWLISDNLTQVQRFIFGYPVSIVVIFILTWGGKLLNIKYLEGIILVFSAITIYKIARDKRGEIDKGQGRAVAVGMLIYSICIFIVFRIFILPSSPPTPQHLGLFYQDSLWNLGITWSYIRGFPLEDAKFSGVLFGYQMLKSIYHAAIFNVAKIEPFYIHFLIAPIFDWFMMVFIVLYGAIIIAKLSLRKTIIFCIGLFFSGSFLCPSFQVDAFTNNGVGLYFGLPILILFILYIISYLDNQRQLDIIYLAALYIYFTGTKAILGIIIPLVLIILNIFRKGFFPKEILFIFSLFLSAVLLKFTIFQNAIHKLYYDYDTTRSLAYFLFKQMYFIRDYADIIYPIYRFFSNFIRYLPKYIFNWPVLLFFIVLFTNSGFRKRIKYIKSSLLFISIFFIVSITMGCFFVFPGSGIYNVWYTQAVFLLLGVFALDYILEINNLKYKIISSLLLISSIIVYTTNFIGYIKIGWGALPEVKVRIWDERATISYDEWQAMKWLQKNTKPDQIFFSDRRYFAHETKGVDLPRFYGYTALSGRQAFAEGESAEFPPGEFRTLANERWNLINKFLFSADISEQRNLLKIIPAGYFIQSLRFDKKDFSKIESLRLVYENREIKIFQILK